MAIQSANGPTKLALIYLAPSLARLARRRGSRVQISVRYVMAGAGVGRPAARAALRIFRRCFDLPVGDRSHGWMTITPAMVEACWRVAERSHLEGLLRDPCCDFAQVEWVGVTTVPAKGSSRRFRCLCSAHHRGDRRPSGVWDAATGVGTCQRSGAVFLVEPLGGGRLALRRLVISAARASRPCALNNAPRGGDGVVCASSMGSAVPDWDRGLFACGRLREWAPGRTAMSLRVSSSRSRLARIRWAAQQFGGPAGEAAAWEEAWLQERGDLEGTVLPDRLMRIADVRVWRGDWVDTPNGGRRPLTEIVTETGTWRVLSDLDGFGSLSMTRTRWEAVAAGVELIARGSWLVRAAEVGIQTSTYGLQVVWILREWNGGRASQAAMYQDQRVRAELARISSAVLEVIRGAAGCFDGEVDSAVWRPGQCVRLPGFRVRVKAMKGERVASPMVERAVVRWTLAQG